MMSPNVTLPIIRKTFPSCMTNEILSEKPLHREVSKIIKKNFVGFKWKGGWVHSFHKGYEYIPKKLYFVVLTTTTTEYKGCTMAIQTEKEHFKVCLWKEKECEFHGNSGSFGC